MLVSGPYFGLSASNVLNQHSGVKSPELSSDLFVTLTVAWKHLQRERKSVPCYYSAIYFYFQPRHLHDLEMESIGFPTRSSDVHESNQMLFVQSFLHVMSQRASHKPTQTLNPLLCDVAKFLYKLFHGKKQLSCKVVTVSC